MTGFAGRLSAEGVVSGWVVEQDGTTPIPNATVSFSGVGLEGDTLAFQFVTDSLGTFVGTMAAGQYQASASAQGYEETILADSVVLQEGATLFSLCFVMHEVYAPVGFVLARSFGDHYVKVDWGQESQSEFEDFEAGGFGSLRWDNTISAFPWVITSSDAYNSTYCMKSACEGASSGVSEIELVVMVPAESRLSFSQRISSEDTWDIGKFSVDGVVKCECSGNGTWEEVSFVIPEGVHVLRWSYVKDADIDMYDDCYYVDDIRVGIDTVKSRSLHGFNVYRRRYAEEPALLAANLTGLSFMEMEWSGLPWGEYYYGVSCIYEGNRTESEIVWSNPLGKDLTTTFEVVAATNTGLVPSGAMVSLLPQDSIGTVYSGVLDDNGRCLLDAVARGNYWVSVRLDGYEDYLSDSLVAIFDPLQWQVNLSELIFDLDGLYVSPTGWAMLSLADSLQGYVQHYEVMLDSIPVGSMPDLCFQIDVETLTPGQTYHCMARPVFLSGTGEWTSCDWNYRACSDFPGPSDFAIAEIGSNALQLDWSMNATDSLLGIAVFRNGRFLELATENPFVDASPEFVNDHVEYCLRAVYDSTETCGYFSMSCALCVGYDLPDICDPTVNLEGENFYNDDSDYGALISWGERPTPVNQWMYYDNDSFLTALGADGKIYWGIKFESDELAGYIGSSLSKVALYDVAAGAYQLWIYFGDEVGPNTLVHYQNMQMEGSNCWHTETLAKSLPLLENTPVWVIVSQLSISYPAAACQNTGNPNGRWVSADGVNWTDLSYYNLDYTWMLRAFVTNQAKETMLGDNGRATLLKYNVYRSYDGVDYAFVGSVPHVEGNVFYQYQDVLVDDTHNLFYYQVRAYYDTGCESDPALALTNPAQDYVVVDDAWGVQEPTPRLGVYPNPSHGMVRIGGENVLRVSVTDVMGRIVLVSECVGEEAVLDLSQLQNGLYVLNVVTQNGLETHRVLLSR